ncbi:MAG: hypothetical protein ACKO4Q_02090 [Planctomycetota bacterium]
MNWLDSVAKRLSLAQRKPVAPAASGVQLPTMTGSAREDAPAALVVFLVALPL